MLLKILRCTSKIINLLKRARLPSFHNKKGNDKSHCPFYDINHLSRGANNRAVNFYFFFTFLVCR